MRRIVFATSNQDKMKEIREILADVEVEIVTMREAGYTGEIEENGESYRDNAAIKASAVAEFLKGTEYADAIVLADDSGLEIDAMGKLPGVQSHRWLGERSYTQAMLDILEELWDIPEEERTARFVCSIAAYVPGEGGTVTVEETCEGVIAHQLAGEEGFGYDPFFYLPEYGCTTAEMTREQKNQVSHRGKALRSMKERLLAQGALRRAACG